MTTLVIGIAGIITLLFAVGFIAYALLGENLIMGALRGKAKPLQVGLLIGSVIVLLGAVIGVFGSLITQTEGDFLDRVTDAVMAALTNATSVTGFLAILFGIGFLAYSLFGDFGLTGVLSGKTPGLDAAVTIGVVVLLAAVIFGVASQLLTGDGTGGSFLQTIFQNVGSGLGLPSTAPTTP